MTIGIIVNLCSLVGFSLICSWLAGGEGALELVFGLWANPPFCQWLLLSSLTGTAGLVAGSRRDDVPTGHRERGTQGRKRIDGNAHRITAVGHQIGQPVRLERAESIVFAYRQCAKRRRLWSDPTHHRQKTDALCPGVVFR